MKRHETEIAHHAQETRRDKRTRSTPFMATLTIKQETTHGIEGECGVITIQTTCRQCGCDFIPSPRDIRGGTWRICPLCRDGRDSEDSGTFDPTSAPQERSYGLYCTRKA